MGIVITHRGSFQNTERLFKRLTRFEISHVLNKYGKMGVAALAAATPVDSGTTSEAWSYSIEKNGGNWVISWENTNVNNGVNIALILQLGHGTGTGGYVQGIDYINPALKPVFQSIADEAWREVTKA